MSRCQFIRACTEPWPVQVLCHLLAVSPAGYYQWQQRLARSTSEWQQAAQAAFTHHARRYGTRRLRAELRAEGHAGARSQPNYCLVAALLPRWKKLTSK